MSDTKSSTEEKKEKEKCLNASLQCGKSREVMFKQTNWDKVQATQQLSTSLSSQACTGAAPAQPQHTTPLSIIPQSRNLWERGREGRGEKKQWQTILRRRKKWQGLTILHTWRRWRDWSTGEDNNTSLSTKRPYWKLGFIWLTAYRIVQNSSQLSRLPTYLGRKGMAQSSRGRACPAEVITDKAAWKGCKTFQWIPYCRIFVQYPTQQCRRVRYHPVEGQKGYWWAVTAEVTPPQFSNFPVIASRHTDGAHFTFNFMNST